MILREQPLFAFHKPHQHITEKDIGAAFQNLSPREKQQFLCLRDNAYKPFTRMTDVLAENSFAIPQLNATTSHGLYLLHSRFNHSCIPNSKAPISGGEDSVVSFATRDIAAGEEITICYNTDFGGRTRRERHQALRFTCDCRACRPGTFQQLSDMRRTLVRGLQYLTLGQDLDGRRSSIIFNPRLRKAAEDYSIPISARLIYNLLMTVLLEQEGLLDEFMEQRMKPGISLTATMFETESNIEIARCAMAQDTWKSRLGTALSLDGREDAADSVTAIQLQRLQALRARK